MFRASLRTIRHQFVSDCSAVRAYFSKMACLAVFDFDRTVVLDDSDATIINKLKENKPPPEWENSNKDWTPYMSDVSFLLALLLVACA